MAYQRVGRMEYGLLAALSGLAIAAVIMLIGQSLAPQPIAWSGITIDRLSAFMALLVAGVGVVAYRFSLRYLDGEPGQRRFLHWLAGTVGMAYLLMLSTNLLLLFIAWAGVSFGLHQLLTFYRNRVEAQRPARKKFLISRLGDMALLSAIGIIWMQWDTLDLRVFLQNLATPTNGAGASTAVAVLIAIAALTKSAQFPFHSWLPETMESPTPVSALMHAGIINAGGVLLLRFAPLLAITPEALFLLVVIGTATAALGTISMWAQTKVKRTLAWSTVSQMGFMMVQVGLAAFPAAALHIIGHGCYKAWSFLRAGDLPKPAPAAAVSPMRTLFLAAIGTIVAIPALWLAAQITAFNPLHSPGELALSAIVALSIGQLWVAIFRRPLNGIMPRLFIALAMTLAIAFAAFALYKGAILFLAPVLGNLPVQTGLLAWIAALLPVFTFTALVIVHTLLPNLSRTAQGRALYVHALHGFYVGLIADRVVDRIWRTFAAGRM